MLPSSVAMKVPTEMAEKTIQGERGAAWAIRLGI
jgi:hypothetical protein